MTDHSTTTAKHKELVRVYCKTLPMLFRAAPLEVSLLAVALIVGGLVPTVGVVLTKFAVDGVAAASGGEPSNLALLAVLWGGTILLGQLSSTVQTVLQGHAADKFTIFVTTALLRKMQELPGLDIVEDQAFHDDVELLQVNARFRPLNLIASSVWALHSLVVVIGLAASLLLVGWWVPLALLSAALPLALTTVRLQKAGWSLTIKQTPESRELAYDARVALRHEYAKETRLYGLLPWLLRRYEGRAAAMQRESRALRERQAWGVLPASLLLTLVASGVLVYAVVIATRGALTAGSVVLVVQGLSQLRASLGQVVDMTGLVSQHLEYFLKFFAFLSATPRVAAPVDPRPLPTRFDLAFENVSFSYPDGRAALRSVSFVVPEGQVVAIVGENGAGKSTLVKLLLRYDDATAGRVTIGGTDVRDLDPAAWRREVGAVFQDFSHFEYTVRENIELASDERRSDAKLDEALKGSGFERVLDALPNGLDTRLGAAFGGTSLSGGQWQKLATARALYRDARVLVLDEPTAAQDPRSEHEVFERFAEMARGKTALLITHRLASVRMADRVLVLKRGELIEDGTHTELLARGGEYAELWRLQAEKYGREPQEVEVAR